LIRAAGLDDVGPVTVVTGDVYLDLVESAAEETSVELDSVIIEPVGRNTAPAVIAAALLSEPDEVLLVLPSDHAVADAEAFRAAVALGVAHARDGSLVTFGAEPSRPEPGYGYIEKGTALPGAFRVARFKEKPDAEEAGRLVAEGSHLWNSGMFVFTANRFLEEARMHSPDLVDGVVAALPPEHRGRIRLEASFAGVTSISIDHAVMEKTDAAVVIPIDVGWSDIGSWLSLWELTEHDEMGNVLVGEVTALGVRDSYVLSSSRQVAVAGLDGMVVVETPDAVLVVPMHDSKLVRDLADARHDDQQLD
jgi:mannose-1-phosphate guanylyltransferase/mannose-6-phosphate isomerase